jgi:hypothetical protein
MKIGRPDASEYAPFYAAYVSLVPEEEPVAALREQWEVVRRTAESVPRERETYRYGEGKWSVRELFGHLGDGERVFGYRMFCISRGDETALPGFDEKVYVASSGFDGRPLSELVQDLRFLRESNLSLLRALDEKSWHQMGNANGFPVSVRALAFIAAGHVRHHLKILAERYGIPTAGA